MALFGLFGNDEQEYEQQREQPREKSFLSKVGSFLMGALKFALIATAAVVTLGAVFKFSDTAKEFADKNLGGLGTGTVNLLDKGWNTVKETFGFGSTDSPPPPASTKTKNVGGVEVLTPNPELTGSKVVATPNEYKEFDDIKGARAKLEGARVSDENSRAGKKILNEKSKDVIQAGLQIENWNKDVSGAAADEQVRLGAPAPKKIDLVIPELPASLEQAGATRNPSSWSGFSPLQKIQSLVQSVGLPSDPLNKPEALEQTKDLIKGNIANKNSIVGRLGSEGSVTKVEQVVPFIDNQTWADHFDTSRAVKEKVQKIFNLDKEWNNNAKIAIAELVEQKRFQEATVVAAGAKEYLEKLSLKLDNSEKDRGAYYNQAIESMEKIKQYTVQLQERKELEPIVNQTYTNINAAARQAPIVLAGYNKQIEEFGKRVRIDTDSAAEKAATPAPATTTQEELQKALNKGTKGDSKGKNEVTADDALASPPPLSVVPPKEQAGLGK